MLSSFKKTKIKVFHQRTKVKNLPYKTDFTARHKSSLPFPPGENKQIWMELSLELNYYYQ